jgi:homoserine/homoserine lactone efflux protein
MSWKIWALFAVTETVLCLKPGPAVMLVVAQGLSRGRIAALWSSIGILVGNAFYFLISATGLGAILLSSYQSKCFTADNRKIESWIYLPIDWANAS